MGWGSNYIEVSDTEDREEWDYDVSYDEDEDESCDYKRLSTVCPHPLEVGRLGTQITLSLTPKQLDDFLQQFVCKARLEDAKNKLCDYIECKTNDETKPRETIISIEYELRKARIEWENDEYMEYFKNDDDPGMGALDGFQRMIRRNYYTHEWTNLSVNARLYTCTVPMLKILAKNKGIIIPYRLIKVLIVNKLLPHVDHSDFPIK